MADIKEVLRRVVDELDTEDRNELLLELKDRKLTSAELVSAIRELPPEARAEVRDAFLEVAQETKSEKGAASKLEADAEEEEEARGVEGEKETPSEKKSKKRPGRKNGKAYGWYVDEKGRVQVNDVATVYSGEDEPDEVEMYPDEEEEETEEEV